MKDTRVYRSADIGSNHYLVCTTVKLERNIIEQVKEWQATLNLHFIDFVRLYPPRQHVGNHEEIPN